jgi:NDP-sugar pyrophosphorylase family protein
MCGLRRKSSFNEGVKMRAVLLATGFNSHLLPLVINKPVQLLKIGDTPFIDHILNFLIQEGISQFDIVLSHHPEMVEDHLRDGQKLGVEITYHLAKHPDHPFLTLSSAASLWKDSQILLIFAEILPQFSLKEFLKKAEGTINPTLLFFLSGGWTGWGVFPLSSVLKLPSDTTKETFLHHFPEQSYTSFPAAPYLSLQSLSDLHRMNNKIFEKEIHLKHTAKNISPGIWISQGAQCHKDVKFTPPVFVGEASNVKGGAQIGPYAIIESNCLIDSNAKVEYSLICEKSYIGEAQEIKNSIVDRSVLINSNQETFALIKNDFVISEFHPFSFQGLLLDLMTRAFSLFLIFLFSPLLCLLFLNHKVKKRKVLYLPASPLENQWKTYNLLSFKRKDKRATTKFFELLPSLINIVKGELGFVGVSPRTPEEVRLLPPEWRKIYLKSKSGLITEAIVDYYGTECSSEELYAAEAFYTIKANFLYDIRLFFRWLKKVLKFT